MQPKKWCFPSFLFSLLLLVVSALPSPAADFQIVTTPQLKQWLEASQKPVLVFTLSQVEFYEQRIPGSVCIPTEEMQHTTALPESRDTPLVFYCKGPG